MTKGKFIIILGLISLPFLLGCASTKVTFTTIERPIHELPGIHLIAVLDLADFPDSPGSGRALSSALVSKLKGGGDFRIVEREELDKVLREQALGMSGVVDEKTAVRVGEILGIEAVIVGEVVAYESHETRETKTETRRFRTGKWHYEKKRDSKTKEEKEVKVYEEEERPVDVFYRHKRASVGANFRVVNTLTGEVIVAESRSSSFDKRVPESGSDYSESTGPREHGGSGNFFADIFARVLVNALVYVIMAPTRALGDGDALPSDGEVLLGLTNNVASELAVTISPHLVRRTVRLFKGSSRESRRGVELARGDMWDEAILEWEKASRIAPDDPAPHYDLGVAFEKLGQPQKARGCYEKALLLRPEDKAVKKALARVVQTGEVNGGLKPPIP